MQLKRVSLAVTALLVGLRSTTAHAQDEEAVDTTEAPWKWTGFYAGLGASAGKVLAVPDIMESSANINGVPQHYDDGASPFASLQVFTGYALQIGPLVVGVEAEIDLGGPVALGDYDPVTGVVNFTEFCVDPVPGLCGVQGVFGALDLFGRARATMGVEVHPNALVFLSGGLSLADATIAGLYAEQRLVLVGSDDHQSSVHAQDPLTQRLLGGNVGIGGQLAVTDNVFIRGELIHDFFFFGGFDDRIHLQQSNIIDGPPAASAEQLIVLDEGATFGQTSGRVSVLVSF
jgi:opacity protein-like surface antigen